MIKYAADRRREVALQPVTVRRKGTGKITDCIQHLRPITLAIHVVRCPSLAPSRSTRHWPDDSGNEFNDDDDAPVCAVVDNALDEAEARNQARGDFRRLFLESERDFYRYGYTDLRPARLVMPGACRESRLRRAR